jgi:CRISPR-associated protein Cas1
LNALLGYGYAILQSRVHAVVGTVGLDPYLGFLHQLGRSRPAFVLDMLEEFRAPIVDFTCVHLVRRWGNEGWWETTEEGARLAEEAKRELIASLEQRLARHTVHAPTRSRVTWTRAIELQVRGLAAALTRGVDRYRPVRPARLTRRA